MNWLDITTSYNWSRPPVGIVRVELEAINYSLNHRKNTKFCIFNKKLNKFYEIKKDEVRMIVDSLSHMQTQSIIHNNTSRKYHKFVFFLRLFLFYILRDKEKKIEVRLKKYKPLIINIYINSKRFLKSLVSFVKLPFNCLSKKKNLNTEIFFKKNDTYISMGLDWDNKDLKYLYDIKKKNKFNVKFFCYDIIPILYPHLCSGNVSPIFIDYYINLAHVSDHVYCISANTRKDLVKFWRSSNAPIKSTSIVRLGDTEIIHDSALTNFQLQNLNINHLI